MTKKTQKLKTFTDITIQTNRSNYYDLYMHVRGLYNKNNNEEFYCVTINMRLEQKVKQEYN